MIEKQSQDNGHEIDTKQEDLVMTKFLLTPEQEQSLLATEVGRIQSQVDGDLSFSDGLEILHELSRFI